MSDDAPPPVARRRRGLPPAVAVALAALVVVVVGGGFVLLESNHSRRAVTPPAPPHVDPARRATLTRAALAERADWPAPLTSRSSTQVLGPCPIADVPAPDGVPVHTVRSAPAGSYLNEDVVFDDEADAVTFETSVAGSWRGCLPYFDFDDRGRKATATLTEPVPLGLGQDSVYRRTTYHLVSGPGYSLEFMLMRQGDVVVGISGYAADDRTSADRFRQLLGTLQQRIAAVP